MAVRMTQGYSKERLEQSQLRTVTPLLLLGDGKLQIVPEFKDKKPIKDTVANTKVNLYYPGIGIMPLKLPADYTLPKFTDMAKVELIDGEAYVNQFGNLYIRASGIKEK